VTGYSAVGRCGGLMVSELVNSTPDQAVQVRALARALCCALGHDT